MLFSHNDGYPVSISFIILFPWFSKGLVLSHLFVLLYILFLDKVI